MITILRIVLLLGGLFFGWIGVGFVMDPAGSAEGFGMSARDTHGLSTIRGDMAAFFIVGALGLIWGAARRTTTPLIFTAALFGVAIIGRAINLLQVGDYAGWWMPMTVEAVTVVICLIAARALPAAADA